MLGANLSQTRRADSLLGEAFILRYGLWQIFSKENINTLDWIVTAVQQSNTLPKLYCLTESSSEVHLCLGYKKQGLCIWCVPGQYVSWEETETRKNCGSTAVIPCGAAGDMCWSDLVIVGHGVPLPGKVVLQYHGYGLREGASSHSVFKGDTSLSSLLKHLFWLL